MPDDRTLVTELATALGTLPCTDARQCLSERPAELLVPDETWDRLAALYRVGTFASEFAAAFANGRAFLGAPDALRGRHPRLVEWTGGRRPPGDEVAPVDLRIDHVYLVSCKYLSHNIANPSPARLFEGLLATTGAWSQTDWYAVTAPEEYQALYDACRDATGVRGLPDTIDTLTSDDRRRLQQALPGRSYPDGARLPYRALCTRVSAESARRWRENVVSRRAQELQAWRLLRIGNATYFLLGSDAHRPLRLRVASPWDWRQAYQLLDLDIAPADAGQPRVDWAVIYRERATGRRRVVKGHVEVRWSHGRFAQPPEAKVYLDTPTDELPGYFALGGTTEQPALWD